MAKKELKIVDLPSLTVGVSNLARRAKAVFIGWRFSRNDSPTVKIVALDAWQKLLPNASEKPVGALDSVSVSL